MGDDWYDPFMYGQPQQYGPSPEPQYDPDEARQFGILSAVQRATEAALEVKAGQDDLERINEGLLAEIHDLKKLLRRMLPFIPFSNTSMYDEVKRASE